MMLIVFYLIIKGVIFLISLDIASIIDIIVGIVIYVSLSFNLPGAVIVIAALFLIQKGLFSLAT